MRSRYVAYCRGNVDYLIATHHPLKRSPLERDTLTKSMLGTTWLGLTVLQTAQGQPTDETGMVEFIARYRAPTPQQIHERSHFKKRNGHWVYWDGELLPPIEPKRNDPCWCSSGKKFKQCHGRTP